MTNEPDHPDAPTREWQPDRNGDSELIRLIPPIKWDFFAGRVQPFGDAAAAAIWDALFDGVNRPFEHDAGGWMMKMFRHIRPKQTRSIATDDDPAVRAALVANLNWDDQAPSYLVFSTREVFTARSADLLDCFRRGWIPITNPCQNLYLCSESSPQVAVFMEGRGPHFGRRKPGPLRK